ncbi:hypothetical protein [Lactobacillus sp. PSON]|uniref:hypothetical protein n=1 Tax=Lactobacillus sp. PSON TaxID=3455454 RepID=UPI004041FCF4
MKEEKGMTKRTKKIIVIGILFYLIVVTYCIFAAIKDVQGVGLSNTSAITMFFNIQFSEVESSLTKDVINLLIISGLSSFYIIFMKNNNQFNNIIQRIGYKKFFLKSIVNVFCTASLLTVFVYLYELIVINWFYFPLNFSGKIMFGEFAATFSNNFGVQTIWYILSSSIGWGIFAVLIFAIGLFIKKNAIYLILSAVVGLALIMFVFLLPINSFTIFLVNILSIFNLIAPGQISFNSQYPPLGLPLTWIIIAIIYASVSFLLIRLWYKKQLRGA